MKTVAALFVDPRGPYPALTAVDCWDAARDAREFTDTIPVVAHPPCAPWGRLRHLSTRAHEADLAILAIEVVRSNGGVLEHPQYSRLWQALALPLPGEPPDEFGGYTLEISQCEWGHPARKMTWLYIVGVPRTRSLLAPPFVGRQPTHWVSGGRGRVGKKAKTTPVPPGIKVCSAQQRRRTPPLLAAALVDLARRSKVERPNWRKG